MQLDVIWSGWALYRQAKIFRSQESFPIGLQGALVSLTFNQSARVEFETHLMSLQFQHSLY